VSPVTDQVEAVLTDARIDIAWKLFAGWSSADLDAPKQYLSADAVLFDIIGGEYHGWEAIRAYFARGRAHYPDLVLEPTGDFWARSDGLALLWHMSGTQTDDTLGADLVGTRWTVEGLSYLVFDGLTVVREADYHDKGSRERSLRDQA